MNVLVVLAAAAVVLQAALAQSWGGHGHWAGGYGGGYHGPQAAPVITADGFLADTPEVAAAKAAHLSEVARAATYGPSYSPSYGSSRAYTGAGYSGYGGYHGGYHGPLANPVVTADGFLADTPEVAAAKAAHMNLVASQGGHGSYGGHGSAAYGGGYDSSYNEDYDDASHYDDGSYKPHMYESSHY